MSDRKIMKLIRKKRAAGKKTPEIILLDVIDIIKKYIDLSDVIGIYLTGSYARGEEDEESDIDVLVITENVDREMINKGIYN